MSSRGQPRYGGGRGRGPPSPPPAFRRPPFLDDRLPRLEEHLRLQQDDLQGLLIDNQRLAATHVALKQEVHAARYELLRASHAAKLLHAQEDARLREALDRSAKMEADLRAAEAQRAELARVRGDMRDLDASCQELAGQLQALTHDAARAAGELRQFPALKAEVDAMKQEVTRARSAVEYEKKVCAETFEQGQLMEKNLVSMEKEVEKLRAELANAEKRSQATVAASNPSGTYGGNFGNPDPSYGGSSYTASYGMNPVQGPGDGSSQYGPGQGSWNAYDMQRAYGRR